MIPIMPGVTKGLTAIRQVFSEDTAECPKQLTSSDWYFF